MTGHRCALLLVCIVMTACGSSSTPKSTPSAPTPTSPEIFTTASYALTISGFDIVADPSYRPCTPLASPPEGKSVTVFGSVRKEATGGWLFESTSGVSLRFTREAAGRAASGAISGQGRDQPTGVYPVRDLQVRITGDTSPWATVDGEVLASGGGVLMSRVTGQSVFSNSRGATGTCPTVQAFLRPGVPAS